MKKTLAVVGIGYWGKNLIRVFEKISNIKTCVHTGNPANEEWVKENFPSISITTNYETILEDPEIDAVIIATPINTHYPLTKQALLSGKHVFVEKPLATNAQQAKELKDISEDNQVTLFVGYIFCYHPTLQPIFDRAENQSIKWARFTWNKLGEFEKNIFFDLVSHAIAVSLKLFCTYPQKITLVNEYAATSKIDIATVKLTFPNSSQFEIIVNRLTPYSHKSLQVLLDDDLLVWTEFGLYEFFDTHFELINQTNQEPLLFEAKRFIYTVQNNDQQLSGTLGYNVNKILEQVHET